MLEMRIEVLTLNCYSWPHFLNDFKRLVARCVSLAGPPREFKGPGAKEEDEAHFERC